MSKINSLVQAPTHQMSQTSLNEASFVENTPLSSAGCNPWQHARPYWHVLTTDVQLWLSANRICRSCKWEPQSLNPNSRQAHYIFMFMTDKPMTTHVHFVDRLATNQRRHYRAVYMPSPCQSKMSPAVKHCSLHRFGRRRQRRKPEYQRNVYQTAPFQTTVMPQYNAPRYRANRL